MAGKAMARGRRGARGFSCRLAFWFFASVAAPMTTHTIARRGGTSERRCL
jgi:hypothetical protein